MTRQGKAIAVMSALAALLLWREINQRIDDAGDVAWQAQDDVVQLRDDLERVERQADEAERRADYAAGRADEAADEAEAARRRSAYGYSPYSYRYGW